MRFTHYSTARWLRGLSVSLAFVLLVPAVSLAQDPTGAAGMNWVSPSTNSRIASTAPVSFGVLMQNGERHAVFSPSPDHDRVEFQVPVVTRYELSVVLQSGATPPPLDLGKPSPVDGALSVNIEAYLTLLSAGTHTAAVRAIGPAGASDPTPDVSFTLTPRIPGAPGSLQIIIRTTSEVETVVDAATGAVLDQRTTSRTTTEVIEK